MAEFCAVWGKHRYPLRTGAEDHLRQLQRTEKYPGKVYLCQDCGGWHVGRPTKPNKLFQRERRGH